MAIKDVSSEIVNHPSALSFPPSVKKHYFAANEKITLLFDFGIACSPEMYHRLTFLHILTVDDSTKNKI